MVELPSRFANEVACFGALLGCGSLMPFRSSAAPRDPRVLTALASPVRARRESNCMATAQLAFVLFEEQA